MKPVPEQFRYPQINTRMKKLIFGLMAVVVLWSCEKEENLSSILVRPTYYNTSENLEGYLVANDIPVYLFKNISWHDGYTYNGGGYLKNTSTNALIKYDETDTLTSGSVWFEDLKMVTHTIVIDFTETKIDNWIMSSINLGNSINREKGRGEINNEVDIWPYMPWEL